MSASHAVPIELTRRERVMSEASSSLTRSEIAPPKAFPLQPSPSPPVFRPGEAAIAQSQMTDFIRFCEGRAGKSLGDAHAFHAYSVQESEAFWTNFVAWSHLICEGSAAPVRTSDRCETAAFFPELRLNYVENLLAICSRSDGDRTALTACAADGTITHYTRRPLRNEVLRFAAALRRRGVETGDRVVAVGSNSAATVIGALGAAALGATFASASPDMGTAAILARFQQLSPRVLLAMVTPGIDAAGNALRQRIADVAGGLPSIEFVVTADGFAPTIGKPVYGLSAFVESESAPDDDAVAWTRFPFNHPLFILFSSGTTGVPKCIVHGAGGTLVEHLKEHLLHGDLRASDTLFFQTSAAWMMWNWQLSALACGAQIVLYDGPVNGPETLWTIVAQQQVTVFGTSPPYLRLCVDAGYAPAQALMLPGLRAVLSTGSVLHDSLYDWASRHVGPVPLQSISGGSDIIGCFVLGHPNLPVHRGESQCKSLGLDVRAFDESGAETVGSVGELVCCNPFPSRPLGFYGDHGGSRFHAAYFSQNPGVWTHGDLIEMTEVGGARIHGRSDSTLNVNGIRIGPSEIYRIVQTIPEVSESLVVEQNVPGSEGDTQLVLLIVPTASENSETHRLDDASLVAIRKALATNASPAHVPALIVSVPELPSTYSGKRSEAAVRDALNGRPLTNTDALRNPNCLVRIRDLVAREERRLARPAPSGRDIAEQLSWIWDRTLRLRHADPDDTFFDLGGTSIMSMRLCHEIQERLGISVAPWILFHAPTLRALTIALTSPHAALSPIVPIRPKGSGAPLYMIPGMYGDVMELHALSTGIVCERPLFGLRARGLAPGETPHRSVEAVAADYVEHVRAFQNKGPYALAGYSFGGLVAFEMACQLHEAGEQVEFLGLIDVSVHERCLGLMACLAFWLARPWRYARLIAKAPLERGREFVARYRAIRKGCAPGSGDSAMLSTQHMIATINRAAFARYRPRPYGGAAIVFRASHPSPRFCDPLPVWRSKVRDTLTIIEVPGDHFDVVRGATAFALGRQLGMLATS